jgi:hypothetical protein
LAAARQEGEAARIGVSDLPLRRLLLYPAELHPDQGSLALRRFDWEVLGRLHCKGLIADPVGRAKSVVLTDEGLHQSEALFRALFTQPD